MNGAEVPDMRVFKYSFIIIILSEVIHNKPTSWDEACVCECQGSHVVAVLRMHRRAHPHRPVARLPHWHELKLHDCGIDSAREHRRAGGVDAQRENIRLVTLEGLRQTKQLY